MSDRATGGRADKTVVTGDMAGDAADRCAFKATLCVGLGAHHCDCQRQGAFGKEPLADKWRKYLPVQAAGNECHRRGLRPQ